MSYLDEQSQRLLDAARRGDNKQVEALITAGSSANVKDKSGWTPLHWAVVGDNTNTVKILLEAGANIDAKDNWGGTPLHLAANNNCAETVQALLLAGANLEAKDIHGRT